MYSSTDDPHPSSDPTVPLYSDAAPQTSKGWFSSLFGCKLPYAFPRAYPEDNSDDEVLFSTNGHSPWMCSSVSICDPGSFPQRTAPRTQIYIFWPYKNGFLFFFCFGDWGIHWMVRNYEWNEILWIELAIFFRIPQKHHMLILMCGFNHYYFSYIILYNYLPYYLIIMQK